MLYAYATAVAIRVSTYAIEFPMRIEQFTMARMTSCIRILFLPLLLLSCYKYIRTTSNVDTDTVNVQYHFHAVQSNKLIKLVPKRRTCSYLSNLIGTVRSQIINNSLTKSIGIPSSNGAKFTEMIR